MDPAFSKHAGSAPPFRVTLSPGRDMEGTSYESRFFIYEGGDDDLASRIAMVLWLFEDELGRAALTAWSPNTGGGGGAAGKSSAGLQTEQDWATFWPQRKRQLGQHDFQTSVDELMFGVDIDGSVGAKSLAERTAFDGAAGMSTSRITQVYEEPQYRRGVSEDNTSPGAMSALVALGKDWVKDNLRFFVEAISPPDKANNDTFRTVLKFAEHGSERQRRLLAPAREEREPPSALGRWAVWLGASYM